MPGRSSYHRRILRPRHGTQSESQDHRHFAGVLLKAKRDSQIPSLKFEMDSLVLNTAYFVSSPLSAGGGLLSLPKPSNYRK
jgi:hypothetical protein